MATFNGSAGDDFIHVAGDGHSPPDGSTEFDEASAGFDDITPGAGFDTVYAGDGVDRVHFSGRVTDYYIAWEADGTVVVADMRPGAPDGADVLHDVEMLVFDQNNTEVSRINGATRISLSDVSDEVEIDAVNGGMSVKFLNATPDARIVVAQPGSLQLLGNGGDDTIRAFGDLDAAGLSSVWPVFGTLDFVPIAFDLGSGNDILDLSRAGVGINPRHTDPLRQFYVDIAGSDGDDLVVGSPTLFFSYTNAGFGGVGSDEVTGGAAFNNTFDCSDLFVSLGSPGVICNLAAGTAAGAPFASESAVLHNIANAIGTNGNDTITGSAAANLIAPGRGTDVVHGGDQEDGRYDIVVVFPSGACDVDLEAGTATSAFHTYTFDLIEGVSGSNAADTIDGSSDDNLLFGNGGNDTVDGRGGTDIAVLFGNEADYQIAHNGDGSITVTDLRSA